MPHRGIEVVQVVLVVFGLGFRPIQIVERVIKARIAQQPKGPVVDRRNRRAIAPVALGLVGPAAQIILVAVFRVRRPDLGHVLQPLLRSPAVDNLAAEVQVTALPRPAILQVGCQRVAGPDHGCAGLHCGEAGIRHGVAGVGASGGQGVGDAHAARRCAALVLWHDLKDQFVARGDPGRVLPQVLGHAQVGLGRPDVVLEGRFVVVVVSLWVKAEDICGVYQSCAYGRIVVHAHGHRQPPPLEHRQTVPHPHHLVRSGLDQGEARTAARNVGDVFGQGVGDAHIAGNVAALVDEVDLVGDLVAGGKGVGFPCGDILLYCQVGHTLGRTERRCKPGHQEHA